jgi:acetyltransferase-like isoleucine patch superfamily enzyme
MAFEIGENSQIHPSAFIDVREGFIGEGAIVLEGARIVGYHIQIGREAYIDRYATIGGGSCFDPNAYLKAGDWLHMGVQSQINIARGVTVGHEFGCGIETKIFTHGAYTDSWNMGSPVQWESVVIGDNVWLPNAWVNPGVSIGDNVVVTARSLINRDIPAGCLAGGIPVRIIRENYFPRQPSESEKARLFEEISRQTWLRYCAEKGIDKNTTVPIERIGNLVVVKTPRGETGFDLRQKEISGTASRLSVLFKDQLRRNGIRFRYAIRNGQWSSWKKQD